LIENKFNNKPNKMRNIYKYLKSLGYHILSGPLLLLFYFSDLKTQVSRIY